MDDAELRAQLQTDADVQVGRVDDAELDRFWREAARQVRLETVPVYFGPGALSAVAPPAWSFGSDADAEQQLAAVLDGTRTALAHAHEDLAPDDLPEPGTMSILVDAAGHPRALVVTTAVEVVTLDEVPEAHALAEGATDLAAWRRDLEAYLAAHDPAGRGVRPDMPVVLERIELLHPALHSRASLRAMFGR